jgi:hypothetical protein
MYTNASGAQQRNRKESSRKVSLIFRNANPNQVCYWASKTA